MSQPKLTFDVGVQQARDGVSYADLAEQLVNEMTPDERLQMLDGDTDFWSGIMMMSKGGYNDNISVYGRMDRLKIPGLGFTDGPRGVTLAHCTAFPVAMARGATWDTQLEERVGRAIGLEARANKANYFAGVCINLPRHPAWGRIQETFGEDPILLGEFGAALTRGVQEQVMACVKHYALNSMENARFKVNVDVDERSLHEVYLPHFRRVVEEDVYAVMSAYNSVNGEWAGQNTTLLTDILRKQWGFQGLVMSDYMFGLRDSVLSVKAGLDIEAPFRQQRMRDLPAALESGKLSWSEVDRSARRILAQELKYFATRKPEEPPETVVFCQEHLDLAREVAGRAMVLLKNEALDGERELLPLETSKISKVAVIGRLATSEDTGDRGSSHVRSPVVVSRYQGLKEALSRHKIETLLSDSDTIVNAKNAASAAHVAVLIVGYDYQGEGEFISPSFANGDSHEQFLPPPDGSPECNMIIQGMSNASPGELEASGFAGGGDRKSLRLRSEDVDLINEVTASNPKTVVVIVSAGAVIMEEWRSVVPAVLMGWYSGCEGGHALADVLLGHVDASGRLPYSIPKSEADLPFFDREATQITYDLWHGQRMLDRLGKEAAFPLGYGLSYSTFKLSDLTVNSAKAEKLSLSVTVSNTGKRQGRHVVQVYGKAQVADSDDFPSRVLLGFLAVELEADSPKTVEVEASLRPLQRWQNGQFVYASTKAVVEVAAFSGDKAALTSEITLA